ISQRCRSSSELPFSRVGRLHRLPRKGFQETCEEAQISSPPSRVSSCSCVAVHRFPSPVHLALASTYLPSLLLSHYATFLRHQPDARAQGLPTLVVECVAEEAQGAYAEDTGQVARTAVGAGPCRPGRTEGPLRAFGTTGATRPGSEINDPSFLWKCHWNFCAIRGRLSAAALSAIVATPALWISAGTM